MRVLFTGGTGAFGKAIIPLLTKHHVVWTPTREELDVLHVAEWQRAFDIFQPDMVVHAAALTAVDKAEIEQALTWAVNVEGTRLGLHEAKRAHLRFVYVSSDYVFPGTQEQAAPGYGIKDPFGPVNYYAFSKAAADLLVQEYELGAVIRTSFAPTRVWRYPKAFTDLWTGKDYLSVLAPDLAQAIETPFTGPVHIATERKTVFDLAKRTRPDVQPMLRAEAPIPLPRDVTLDTSSWLFVKQCWKNLYRCKE